MRQELEIITRNSDFLLVHMPCISCTSALSTHFPKGADDGEASEQSKKKVGGQQIGA